MPADFQPVFDRLKGVLEGYSDRLQVKACFNFKSLTDDQFQEIAALTQQGFERFQAEKIV